MTEEQRKLLAFMQQMESAKELMQVAQKHDIAAGTPITGGLYQDGGIFTYPFSNPTVFSAIQQPRTFMSALPLRQTNIENEVVTLITGMTDASGDNATSVCGDPPTPGNLKVCRVNLTFGKAYVGSKVYDLTEVGGQQFFKADPVQIQNFATSGDPLTPDPLRVQNANYFSDSALRLYEVGTMMRRMIARIEVDGSSANDGGTGELGWIKEFSGLSRLVKDGYTDVSGNACTAVDSLVEDWSDAVDGTVNGMTLPQLLNDMYFSRQILARDVGMEGTTFALVMDMRLFRALAYQFACGFIFTRCSNVSDAQPVLRTDDQVERRFREFIQGQYLPLEGMNVPVLFTSGADVNTEETPFTASVFIVPLNWQGRPLTEIEYFNLNNSVVQEFNRMANTTARMYSNNGLYAFATRSWGFCDQLLAVTKLRLKLWTPFLAARIDNISFNSFVGYRNWDPAGSSFYNGGVTVYSGNYFPPAL